MAFDFLAAVLGHKSDDHAAYHGYDDHPVTEMVMLRAGESGRPAMIEKEVRKNTDKLIECESHNTGQEAHTSGQKGNQYHTELGGRNNIFAAGRRDRHLRSTCSHLEVSASRTSRRSWPPRCRRT